MKNIFKIALMSTVITLACTTAYGQEEAISALDSAKKNFDKKRYTEALQQVSKAKVAIFEKAPLSLNNMQIISEPAQAYGIYVARENNVFKAGQPIYVYCEPVGYTMNKKNGYDIQLEGDFTVFDSQNNVLGSQTNFADFSLHSKQPITEFILNLTYTLNDVSPGKYKIQTVLRDKLSGKKTAKDIEVQIE